MMDSLKHHLMYLIKYSLSGAFAALCDYIFYCTMVFFEIMQPGYTNVISSTAGFVIAWLVSGKTVFKSYAITKYRYMAWFIYLFVFLLILSAFLNYLVGLGLSPYLGKIIIVIISFCTNALVFKVFVLRKRESSR